MTLPWEGTDLKAGLCLCVYIQLREQTKVQINDNPTGPEVIALHHEALTLYFKVCVCVCISVHASAIQPQTTFCCLPRRCPHCVDSHGRCGDEGSELYP